MATARVGALHPLLGIPVALKDLVSVAGGQATAGSRILEGYRSPFDAHITERLRAAGAVILGKTNMDEFAMGSSTEHSAFGPTANPWDLGRVRRFQYGPVGFGHALMRTGPEAAREREPCSINGQLWIIADARIDRRADLKAKLEASGRVADGTDAQLILHACHLLERRVRRPPAWPSPLPLALRHPLVAPSSPPNRQRHPDRCPHVRRPVRGSRLGGTGGVVLNDARTSAQRFAAFEGRTLPTFWATP